MTILKEILKIKEQNPSTELLSAYMKEVLKHNPTLVRYEKGKPYIYFEYSVERDADLEEDKDTNNIYYAIRNVQMAEYDGMNETSYKTFINMFRMIETRNLLVSHIVCGDVKKLMVWLDMLRPLDNVDEALQHTLFGVKITQIAELPDDVFILCGAPSKYAQPNEIIFILKGTID